MRLTETEEKQHTRHETPCDARGIRGLSCSSPEGTRRRWASPELVRRTVLEAASAWPELAGCTFKDGIQDRPDAHWRILIDGGPVPFSGYIRRATFEHVRADAVDQVERAATLFRSARAAECQDCKRWGGPPRSGAACDTCGRAVLTADNFAEIEPVLASPDAYATKQVTGRAAGAPVSPGPGCEGRDR